MTPRVLLRDRREGLWLALSEPCATFVARDASAVVPVVEAAADAARSGARHVAGFLTYEAAPALDPALTVRTPGRLPLAWFTAFAQATPVPAPTPCGPLPQLHWRPSLDESAYRRAIATIRELIRAGDTYQVNFSYRLRAELDAATRADPARVFAAMVARQPDGLGAYIETDDWAIACASHELFFAWQDGRVVSRPMKGTAERGADPAADHGRRAWLAASAKNRAENLMITDMVRNDLGRIARPGSVQTTDLFALEQHPTLWQMTSTVSAATDTDLVGILRALFPAASITGAPKRRTMEIIRTLESDPRQIYTGTIGYLRPDGSAQFNVAIRTAAIDRHTGIAEYGVGGGIVWDSDADEEYAESRAKALIVAPAAFELLETLRWSPDAGYAYLDRHLARLARSARYFAFPFDEARIRRALDDAAAGFPPAAQRVRLLLDARGVPTLQHAELAPLPADYRVALAPEPCAVLDSPFVCNKTTNRTLYDRARSSVADVDDVLLWNTRGELTESCIANLVVELDGERVTPPVSSGLLPGVLREHLLESGLVRERVVHRDDLARCTGIWLVNALRGMWPARLVVPDAGDAAYTARSTGPGAAVR